MSVVTVVVLLLVAAAILILPVRSSNCGGNTAASYNCWTIARACREVLDERGDGVVTLGVVREKLEEELSFSPHLDGADFLVLNPRRPIGGQERTLVIVCSQPYDNDPPPTIWNLYARNMGHAAGYSDGTIALISPEEYASLDLSQFIKATEWLPDLP
jgi:hypothetical protein